MRVVPHHSGDESGAGRHGWLSRRSRPPLTLNHYRAAEATFLEANAGQELTPRPPEHIGGLSGTLLLVEIPGDLLALKTADLSLARAWRTYTRAIFEDAFAAGYLITDFVHDEGRSFYVMTHGESTILGW